VDVVLTIIEFHSSTGSALETAAAASSVPHTAAAMTIGVLMMMDSSVGNLGLSKGYE
jgi:hypothetical protein